ncbi:hypothetical protein LCGC14_0568870 [marine sediment metagenome]|uniref:Uncharacterized protein n=1 Tax=marine sediment metagenome TaxID=412755 RepID=A0A0F9U6A9_9ZZZZ|nr:hypothetical protein [Phycisphaerae bacterium]
MAINTKTVQETFLNAAALNTTFEWSNEDFDTYVVAAGNVSGTPDSGTDPQFTIEDSHDHIGWFGATTLNNAAQSSEITVKAPWSRVRTTTENSAAMRVAITVVLRKDT